MSRNGKLEPMEVETMMNEARMLNNIIEVGERMIVSDKMEEARSKHDGREKAIISINPLLIHVPDWQRELRVSIAKKIGRRLFFCRKMQKSHFGHSGAHPDGSGPRLPAR